MTTIKFAALAGAATLALALPAVAQTSPAAVKAAPVSALVKEVNIPYQEFTLKNGLRVIVHTDRKAPVVAVSVWYDVGSKHEPQGSTGFAHLFEHLMFNGSENAPGDFFAPLKQIGATDLNGTTYFDRTNYFETVPTGALDRALFLESDRMGYLLGAITQGVLDEQRGVVQNEKRQGDNRPYGLLDYAVTEGLFPTTHPYGHDTIGSMADLDAASLETVKNWFRSHYGPNNAVLVLSGDIDAATARPLVEKYFGAIKPGPKSQLPVAPVVTLPAAKTVVLKDRVAAVMLSRNWAVPGLNDKDSAGLDVAAGVLGGMASSRFANELVRKEKLFTQLSADNSDFAQIGVFSINGLVRPGVPRCRNRVSRSATQVQAKRSAASPATIASTYRPSHHRLSCPVSITVSRAPANTCGNCSPSSTKMMPFSVNCSMSHTACRRMRVAAFTPDETLVKDMAMPAAAAASTPELSTCSATR